MIWLIVSVLLVLILGWFIYKYLRKHSVNLGVLNRPQLYVDTSTQPGEVLRSTSLPLVGKPDYLIKENGFTIPVEVKTGKTPHTPYVSHTMQLMAYCYLVEESLGYKPPGGYLKYPNKEFRIRYTDEAKESVKLVVQEILNCKIKGEELHCNHPLHN